MSYPFRIGGLYRNRQGEYEVVSIDEPTMIVRFDNGRILTAEISKLAKIWENIQEEAAVPASVMEKTERAINRTKAASRKRSSFRGLTEGDFKFGVKGTTWRARSVLGNLLAGELAAELGTAFKS